VKEKDEMARADTEDVRQAVWLYLVGHLGKLHVPAASRRGRILLHRVLGRT